ncbi:uncharacterized protein [Miscanthus floridulus]|uniref:uncharacterized protein n=1 Tax=Miscanthus floridulus TaxID=154761 RepID=UPI00345A62A8
MAAAMVAKAAVVTTTTTTSGWSVPPPLALPGSNGDHDHKAKVTTTKTIADVVVDEDELFELDIALLDGRDDHHHNNRGCSPAAGADADAGHALLANCLLPLRSLSNAVPVAASGRLSSSYPYSGYYSSRRLFTPGSSRRFLFLGRSAGNSSARLCFSSRGFEAMGNYFQRY